MKGSDDRLDAIDRSAGLFPGDPVHEARRRRPEFVGGTENCRRSVLAPEDDVGFEAGLRVAIARRVARMSENPDLIAEYPAPSCDALLPLAEGGTPKDTRLRAIARHTDMIARAPEHARNKHLKQLAAAGLSVPQIVALSELLAFVCFQAQVAHGLSLLKRDQ